MTTDEKREELREKIEAGEARNAERSLGDFARDAKEQATDFVKEHPIATVAGGLAIGAILAAIIPGPGRRLSRRMGTRAVSLAALAAELGMTYGSGLLDSAGAAARNGQDRLEDFGDTLGDTARGLKREAAFRASNASDSATILSRSVGKKASRTLRNIRGRMN